MSLLEGFPYFFAALVLIISSLTQAIAFHVIGGELDALAAEPVNQSFADASGLAKSTPTLNVLPDSFLPVMIKRKFARVFDSSQSIAGPISISAALGGAGAAKGGNPVNGLALCVGIGVGIAWFAATILLDDEKYDERFHPSSLWRPQFRGGLRWVQFATRRNGWPVANYMVVAVYVLVGFLVSS